MQNAICTVQSIGKVITYLSIVVNRIGGWSIDLQLWLAILSDLTDKWYSLSNVFTFSAVHVVHFEESNAIFTAKKLHQTCISLLDVVVVLGYFSIYLFLDSTLIVFCFWKFDRCDSKSSLSSGSSSSSSSSTSLTSKSLKSIMIGLEKS